MKNFKKILSLVLAAVLLVVLSVTATVAYLTAEADPVENTFTVGDISISLKEEVGTEGAAKVDQVEGGAKYSNVMPGDKLIKKPTVTNDGPNPAYVAITVTMNNADLINLAIDEFYEDKGYSDAEIQAIYDEVFEGWGINYNPRPGAAGVNDARGVIDGTYGLPENVMKVDFSKTTDFDNDTTMFGIDNWFMSETEQTASAGGKYSAWLSGGGYHTSKLVDDPATAEDERDYMIVYVYYAYLEPGESVTVFEGLNVPAEFNRDQLAMFKGLNIKVEAAAIQADNMPSAEYAFMVLNGDEVPTLVSSTEEMEAALAAGETDIIVKGATITENNLNGRYYIDRNIDFVDCTFAANMNYMYINDATYTNCTFDCGSANSAVHYDELFGDLVFNNCTFISGKIQIGVNKDATGTVTFNDCVFEETASTSIWSELGIRVYSPAEFNRCEFYNRVVMAGSNDLPIAFNSCTMNDGTPVYYVDNTDGIIRGGNIPVVTINN